MCQLCRKDFYVFYLSCMTEKQTGFPRRTGKLADIMQSPESNEAHFVALVLSIIRVLNKHAGNMTCEQWIQAQEERNEIQEEVLGVYNQKLPEIKQLEQSKADRNLERCLQQELDQCKVKLLLCIDEAGELGNNFVTFRRSLRSIPWGKKFLSVVLGTDRKVADLAAAAEDDPSARVRLINPYPVYHPLYLIGVSDIFASGSEAETSTAPADVIHAECTAEGNYIQPVTLATFLKTMIGESHMEEMKKSCGNLEEYSLFFNSFTPISVEIFKQLADAAYARCTALTARRNETVIDFALPLHLKLGDSVQSRPMQDTVMMELHNQPKGVVVVGQVKNWRIEMSMNTEIKKLQDDDSLSTPVQLILQIGHRGKPKIEVKGETVVFYGIGCFEHLKSQTMRKLQVIGKLMLLSRTCEDVFKNATKEEQDVLKDMIPIGLASKSFLEDMDLDDEPQVPMKWSRTSSKTLRGRREDVQLGEADAM